MTNEERDLLTSFVGRVSGEGASAPLPELDPEADRLLGELFTRYPQARYRMTQTAFVQEAALHQAQAQITQLQAALEQARAQPPAEPARPSGFFAGVFGGGQPAAPAAPPPRANPWGQPAAAPSYPQPAYPQPAYQQPAYQPPPQMMQPGGVGFFGSAVRTAAGVAGGMVLGNALMNMFSGPHMGGGFGGGFGGGMGGFGGAPVNETTIINNYNEPPPDAGQGGWDQASDPGNDPGSDQGWQDASDSDPGFGGGGFDDSTDV